MLRPASLLLLAIGVASSLSAQVIRHPASPTQAPPAAAAPADSGGHTIVSGFVLDSMTSQPLAGATVIISGTTHTETTDAGGRFRFVLDNLPDGTYTIGFFQPALDSLGITPAPVQIAIRHGTSQFIELGVPSMTTIVHAFCPDTALTDGRGLVAGVVRDAATGAPLSGARVVLMWTGVNVANGSLVKIPKAVSVVTAQDGSYRACGAPSGTRVTAQAREPKRSSGWIEVDVPPGGLALRNFLLGTRPATVASAGASSAAPGAPTANAHPTPGQTASTPRPPAPLGTAVLIGTVAAMNGKPLPSAQVLLLGTPLSTRTDERGAFRLAGLPAGTQSVEIREIGYSPKRYAVDLSPNHESHLAASLEERAVVLQTVEVKARNASPDITGFEQRKKTGMGTYLTREDIEKRGPISMTDLFRGIAGVQVTWDGSEYVVQMTRASSTGTPCPVQYYIDGSPFLASSTDDMDQIVQPQDIEAIEVYKSAEDTPIQFQGGGNNGACGTIVIWTRRGGSSKK